MPPAEHRELMSLVAGESWHLDRLYSLLAKELAPVLRRYKYIDAGNIWKGNEKLKAEVGNVLKLHNIRISSHIEKKILQSWALSQNHSDKMVASYLAGLKVPEPVYSAMMYRNTTLIDNYLKYGRDKKLSERVWKTTEQAKEQIDLFLKEGLSDGRSTAELTKDLRQYLKEPNRRFRRIRDKNGKLILSNPARNYKPGQGVYRSSYNNTLRLARNEINIGYRIADVDRRKRMPFVVGVTVCLSHSHPKYDICDELVGDYPSDYVFTGFHSSCFCYTKSKLLPKEEFKKYLKTGKIPSKYKVKGVDAKRLKYVNSNKDKLKDLYFFKDNKGVWENSVSKKVAKRTVKTPKKDNVRNTYINKLTKSNAYKKSVENITPINIKTYEKELGVKIDRDIFYLLEKDTPLVFENLKGINAEGAYYSPYHNTVRIPIDARRRKSKWKSESVVYHEYGHAIDAHIGLKESKEIKKIMRRYKKELDFAKIDREAKLKYLEASRKKDYDAVEKTGAVLDAIMSLNPNYGAGHTRSYFNKKGNKEAEFIAHCFENAFAGNSIFRELMPNLYNETIRVISNLKLR